MTSKYA